jgi:hypothetical protein
MICLVLVGYFFVAFGLHMDKDMGMGYLHCSYDVLVFLFQIFFFVLDSSHDC